MPGDSPLKHHPFAALQGQTAVRPAPAAKAAGIAAETQPLTRVTVREEFDTEENALIARIIGVPPKQLRAIGARLREALGAFVSLEGRDLLVTTNECDRVAAFLRDEGASEVVIAKRVAPTNLEQAGTPGGTLRSEIRPGLHVAIVTKADQDTGVLTEGVVRELLTSSPTHPRGIKVRLESGQVGRVRRILGPATSGANSR